MTAAPILETDDPMSGDKLGVVVLGMGRSGTSSVTRMFATAGFFAGRDEDLMVATEHNPTGHWENLNVWRVNENILSRLSGTWFDPPPEDQQLAARAWTTPELLAVFEHLVAQANDAPVVLKDPRIGVMLPVWADIVEDYLHPVLVIRDPIEIALSVNRRDGSPISFTLAAWQLHMTTVLRHLQRRVITVAPYRELLGSVQPAELVIESTLSHLKDDLADHIRSTSSPIVPDPELHHNRASPGDHEELLSVRQLQLWRQLASLDPGDQQIDVPDRLLECAPAVRSTVRAESERDALWRRVQQAEHDAATERERSEVLALELSLERERAGSLSSDSAAQRERAERADATALALQTSASWRITAPLRAGKRTLRRLVGPVL